ADLVLTKDVLCQLSYLGERIKTSQAARSAASPNLIRDARSAASLFTIDRRLPRSAQMQGARKRARRRSGSYAAQASDRATQQLRVYRQPAAERETGFEPATLSLEG